MGNLLSLRDHTVKPSVPISGRFLAHNHGSNVVRAFHAGELNLGLKHLIDPTLSQSAYLARVSRTYAFWATKRMDQRAEIEAGHIPLVPPQPKNGHATPAIIDDVAIVDFIRRVGVNRVLEAACLAEAAQ